VRDELDHVAAQAACWGCCLAVVAGVLLRPFSLLASESLLASAAATMVVMACALRSTDPGRR
jgi:hypothetical protein